ncbi:MAG TPA: site-specific DNA-methyltransferase [Candidatus Rokubacteria bacterium]|nr:site-specific DNA-methyltransferase [Candidatus Rokubacteria bacterium]
MRRKHQYPSLLCSDTRTHRGAVSEGQRLPKPYYKTELGVAYLGDSLDFLPLIETESINLIVTSPPFALKRKKEYGNVDAHEYVDWFLPFAKEFWRILRSDGSFVLDIGGSWSPGLPTKTLYNFELLIRLCRDVGFHLAEDFYWLNPAKLPSPAEWVNVRRIRVKDAIDPVWWLSKTPFPKADNREILKPYSKSMEDLLAKGYKAKLRPSGHDISTKFSNNRGGAIPSNLLTIANTESNSYYLRACRAAGLKPHPARYPLALPEFFVKFLTNKNDVVLDPFGGSNITGECCEKLGRRWLAFELSEEYLQGSKFRFHKSSASRSKDRKKHRTHSRTPEQPNLFRMSD